MYQKIYGAMEEFDHVQEIRDLNKLDSIEKTLVLLSMTKIFSPYKYECHVVGPEAVQ